MASGALALQPGAHMGQQAQLGRGGAFIIRHIVGRAGEAVIGHDRRARIGAHQPAGDGEVLALMVLAAGEVRG
jgi:hypothetical protein